MNEQPHQSAAHFVLCQILLGQICQRLLIFYEKSISILTYTRLCSRRKDKEKRYGSIE